MSLHCPFFVVILSGESDRKVTEKISIGGTADFRLETGVSLADTLESVRTAAMGLETGIFLADTLPLGLARSGT